MKKDKLDLKIGSQDQVLWENVRREALVLKKQSEDNIKIQSAILELAEEKIAIEKSLFESKHLNKR